MLPNLESANYTLVLLSIVTIFVGWGRGWWESPKKRTEREQNKAVAVAILGEAAVPDNNGGVITPGQPGLVHRVASVEDAVVEFRHAIGIYTEVLQRMDRAESDIAILQNTNVKDIIQMAERAATATVSAEVLRLVNERDTVDGDIVEPSAEL